MLDVLQIEAAEENGVVFGFFEDPMEVVCGDRGVDRGFAATR